MYEEWNINIGYVYDCREEVDLGQAKLDSPDYTFVQTKFENFEW